MVKLLATLRASKCLKKTHHGSCCCNCAHRHNDRSHPITDGLPIIHFRGYICANPEIGNFSGWQEHGLCECWDKRPVKPRDLIALGLWNNLYKS